MNKERFLIIAGIILFAIYVLWDVTYRNEEHKVELTFGMFAGGQWGVPNDDCYKIIDDAIEKFEEKYPFVKVKYVSGIQKDYYSEWIAEQVLDDEIPDVMMVLPQDFELFSEKSLLMNLDGFIEGDEDFDPSKYYEGCYQAGVYNNSQFALPFESNPKLMFFNKTLLEKYNIEIDENNWTWNDFFEACRQLTQDENKDGIIDSYGVCGYTWIDALYSNGGNIFNKEKNVSNFTSFKVDESITFAKKVRSLSGYQNPNLEDFDLGTVGFTTMRFSEFKTYKPYPYKMNKYKIFDWDCISLPVMKDGFSKSYTDNLMLGISDRTENAKYAWEFLKMLSYDQETQQNIYVYSQGVSVLRDVTNSEETKKIFVDLLGEDSSFDTKMLDDVMVNSVPMEMINNYDYIMDYVNGVISRIMLNEEDMDAALTKIKKRVDTYLKQNKPH